MTWLLKLYPRPWRRRYGAEVAEMLAGRGFSFRVAIDLIAGAIDVRMHPRETMAAARAATSNEQEDPMASVLSRIARFECAAISSDGLTRTDHRKSAAALIGGTIVLTAIWIAAHVRFGDNDLVDALSSMPFFVSLLFSMRFTYLKNRPGTVQAAFIAGFSLLLTAILLAAGWLAGRL